MKEISPKLLDLVVKILIALGILLIIYLTYYYVAPALKGFITYLIPVLLPFIMALILAALINPVVNYLEMRFKLSRGLSVIITMTVVIGGLATGIIWLIVRLSLELYKLSGHIPRLSGELTSIATEIFNKTMTFYFSLDIPVQIIENATMQIQNIVNKLTSWSGQLLASMLTFLSAIPGGVLITLFALIGTFFISRDKEKIRKSVARHVPERIMKAVNKIGKEVEIALIGFIRAQVVLMVITFLQTLIGLYILGIEYALIMALVVGLVDALPVLGPGAVFVPWIIWEFINKDVKLGIALLILYLFVTVVRQILQPKIVSDNVGMHPLEALFAIYGGLQIFGVLGVVIGPILLVTVKAIWRGWKLM